MANAFLDSYIKGVDQSRQQGLANVGQLNTMLNMAGEAEKQRKQREYEAEMASADTPEKQLAVAVRHGGPTAVLAHADRTERTKATQEMAMARLTQQAQQFDANWQLRYRSAQTADERLNLERLREAFKQHLQMEAQRLAGAKAAYDFGFVPAPATAPTVTAQDPLAGRPQAERDAIALVQSGQATSAVATPQGAQIVRGAPATPVPAPPPVAPPSPSSPPIDVPSTPEITPATLSMQQSGGLEGRFPPVGQPPVAPTGPVTAAQVTAPAAPAVAPQSAIPPMPPEIAAAPPRIQNQWRLNQTKASISGGGSLSEDAIRNKAIESLYDPKALVGLNRDSKTVKEIENKRAALMKEAGITPEDVVSGRAGFKADTASLNKITPQYDAITSFENTALRNGKILIGLADKIDTTGVPILERWIRAGRKATGDPDVANFDAQINAYRAEVARILTQPNLSGVLTDSARHEAESFLQSGASAKQIRSVVNLLERDFTNRKATLEEQIAAIRTRMNSRVAPGNATATGATTPNNPAASDDALIKKYLK